MAKYNVGSPMERIAIDVLGPLPITETGNKYILIVADYFTKWVEAYPMPNQEATTVAELLVREFVSVWCALANTFRPRLNLRVTIIF